MGEFWVSMAMMCGMMLVCVAVTALAERKLSERSWRRMMKPLGGKQDV